MLKSRPLQPWKVDELWAKLTVLYGHDFLRQYEGMKLDAVKAEWAEQLGGFTVVTEAGMTWPAIHFALDRLPPRPPNVIVFRGLCHGYTPPAEKLALPMEPRAVPEQHKRVLQQLAMPIEDKRPERVKVAERYLVRHAKDLRPTPRVIENVTYFRQVLADYAAQLEREKRQREEREAAHAEFAQ